MPRSTPPSDLSGLMMVFYAVVATLPLTVVFVLPGFLSVAGRVAGWVMCKRTEGRRAQLIALMNEDDKTFRARRENSPEHRSAEDRRSQMGAADAVKDRGDWDGIIGFFHPFCNAGGGGERVLWAAIRATQKKWPRAKCVVYSGDVDVNKQDILTRVKTRFNIDLHSPTITFLYLSKRHWVLASTWPRFTLLGQSIGSVILVWDAFSLLVPDILIDTMGYAFALGFSKFLCRNIPTCAYVHYPTISTDMLESLDPTSVVGSEGVNAGQGTGIKGSVKRAYWKLFAQLYSWIGSSVDVVMTNSTWTQAHIRSLWGPYRKDKDKNHPIAVVYPPVAVKELENLIDVSEAGEGKRQRTIIYIAQFRPEKNHQLIIQSFSEFIKSNSKASQGARLVLIGSVRDDQDSMKVYQLRLLVNELGLKDSVTFQLDAPWPDILNWLQTASVGVNGMWNEHFGICVVEYQAAGLISVVHDSGGPKLDIVTDVDGQATGFLATSPQDFAAGFEKALSLPNPVAMRQRARKSAQRFTEEEFAKLWLLQMERLISLAA